VCEFLQVPNKFGGKSCKRWSFAYHEEQLGLAGVGRTSDLDNIARSERRAVERRREEDGGPRGEGAGEEVRRRLVNGEPFAGATTCISGHG
jgi:hypothetical protein